MPGPASAELTTENSIKQLQPYTISAFTYSLNSDNLATQQLDGMVKGEGGTSSIPRLFHAKYCLQSQQKVNHNPSVILWFGILHSPAHIKREQMCSCTLPIQLCPANSSTNPSNRQHNQATEQRKLRLPGILHRKKSQTAFAVTAKTEPEAEPQAKYWATITRLAPFFNILCSPICSPKVFEE